jgi:uncharacterized protein DUF4328
VLPPSQPLRRTGGLATALVALLAAQIALIVAEIVARYVQADILRDLQASGTVMQQTLARADGWVSGTVAVDGLVFVAAVVVWCIWQHHAQANAIELSGGGLRFTPGWAVGWWFIPIANLWKPFQAVRELWKASHGGGWQTVATWALLGWWWATWIAGSLNVQLGSNTQFGILFGSSTSLEQLSVSAAISEDRWRALWLAFRLVAAALAIVIVRSVERLQQSAAAANLPAPPAEVGAASPAEVAVTPAMPDGGTPLPPPPPTRPTVDDTISPGERMLIIGVVIGAVALTVAGQVWVGGTRTGSAGAAPSASAGPASPSSPEGGNTYEQHGVRFTYPADWTEGPTSTSGSVGAPPDWTDGFSPPGGTGFDIVIVSAYTLQGNAGSLKPAKQQALVKNLTNSLLSSLQGSLRKGVTPVAIGSSNGYHALMSVTLQGVPIAVDFNVLFQGSHEYTIVCQSTVSARADVAAGCGQIRDTFEVTG